MSEQIILEQSHEIEKYKTSEIIRLDIAVKGAALEALLRRSDDNSEFYK